MTTVAWLGGKQHYPLLQAGLLTKNDVLSKLDLLTKFILSSIIDFSFSEIATWPDYLFHFGNHFVFFSCRNSKQSQFS